MDQTTDSMISIARAEASKMQAAVSGVARDASIRMSVGQFSSLANLIASLCERQPTPDSESFGDARYWVPLDHFVRVRETVHSLEQECARLREGRQTN